MSLAHDICTALSFFCCSPCFANPRVGLQILRASRLMLWCLVCTHIIQMDRSIWRTSRRNHEGTNEGYPVPEKGLRSHQVKLDDCQEKLWLGVIFNESLGGRSLACSLQGTETSLPADARPVNRLFDFRLIQYSDFDDLTSACSQIPAGQVSTYGDVAKALNSSARAVGGALRVCLL